MINRRVKGLLGLAVRAGQAVFGEDPCRRLIGSGKCGVLLLDGDASANTRRRFSELCSRSETAFAVLPEGMIPEATGRDNMVMALKDGTFSEQVTVCLANDGQMEHNLG